MKRASPGILIFLTVWSIVLLSPELRLLLQVQLRGSSLQQASVLPNPDWLNDDFLPQLARQYPNDLRVLAMQARSDLVLSLYQSKDAKRASARYDQLLRRFPNETWLIANRL